MQAGRMTSEGMRAAMASGVSGIQASGDMLWHRAAGFDPSGGRRSYARASNKLARGTDSKTMANMMLMGLQESFSGDQDPEMVSFKFRRFMENAKVKIGPGMATTISENYRSIKGEGTEAIKKSLIALAEREGLADADGGAAAGRLNKLARGQVRKGAGGTIAAAKLQASRIGTGGKMAKVMVDLEGIGIKSVQVLGNFTTQIQTVVNWMKKMMDGADTLTKGDLWSNLMKLLKGDLGKSSGRRKPRG